MKRKNLLITLGLAVTLGVGVAAGLSNGKEAVKADAATSETRIYIDARNTHWFTSWSATNANLGVKMWIDGVGSDVWLWNTDSTMGTITIQGVTYLYFDRDNYSSYTHGLVYAYNDQTNQNCSANFGFGDADPGQNLLTLSGGSDTAGPSVAWGTLTISTTYTVTKHGICDGNKSESWVIGSDIVSAGDEYEVPARANLAGYHYGGWFTDDDCTVAYTKRAINANLDIYVKYTSLSKDSYIYYITDSKTATNNSIHSWGGDFELDGLITSISGVAEVHGVTRFRNTDYLIYKIPFSSEAEDTAFKFHYNNWQTESDEKTLVAGNAYQWGVGTTETDETAGGDALDFILRFESIRNLVAEDTEHGIREFSVCGIVDDGVNNYATALCNAYNALSETARGYVDGSYTYTYHPQNPAYNDNVTFFAMMEEVAANAHVTLEGHSSARIISLLAGEAANPMTLVIIVCSAALLVACGYIVLRKKEHN